MRTVGQILKEEREKQLLSLEQVEKVTKIRVELLKELEADNFHKLPPPTFVQGFIKNYGHYLKLDINKLLAIYRREFSSQKHPPRVMEALANPLGKPIFRLTPAKVLSGVVILLVLAFFGYLWYEFRFLAGAPFLEVSQPQDNLSSNSAVVEVVGRTDAESKVEINSQEVTVEASGNFHQEVNLQDSMNKLIITATSKFGKSTTIERTVYLKK